MTHPAAALTALALAAQPSPGAQGIALLRSDGPWLPESIARESAAAVARAEEWLSASGGGGARPGGQPFPAPDPTLPWGGLDVFDAALAVLDAELEGAPPYPTLCERLRRFLDAPRLRGGGDEDVHLVAAALSACALDSAGIAHAWPDVPPAPRRGEPPSLARVAASALMRLSAGAAPDAIEAHARWIAARLPLEHETGGGAKKPGVSPDPESVLLAALLASQLPVRGAVVAGDEPFPKDWRIHLAGGLLAMQVWDAPTGAFRWDAAPGGCDAARATRCAVLALKLMIHAPRR